MLTPHRAGHRRLRKTGVALIFMVSILPVHQAAAHTACTAAYLYACTAVSVNPDPVAGSKSVTITVRYKQTYNGWSNIRAYMSTGEASSCTNSPPFAYADQPVTRSVTMSAPNRTGTFGLHTYAVASKSCPGPSLYNGYIHDTLTIDSTPPNTTITSGPPDPTTSTSATFTFTSNEGGSTFQCSLDGVAFTSCASPKTYSPVPAGSHTFRGRAIDPVGNPDPTPASWNWTVAAPGSEADYYSEFSADVQSPTVVSDAVAEIVRYTQTFTGYSSLSAYIGSTKVWSAGPFYTSASTSRTVSVSFRAPETTGDHTVDTYIVASSSTPGPTFFNGVRHGALTVGVAGGGPDPPETTVTVGPVNGETLNSRSVTFAFESSESDSTFACSLDGGGFEPCTSPATYDDLSEGGHTFRVRATDASGETDLSADFRNWNIDVAAVVAVLRPTPGAYFDDQPVGSPAGSQIVVIGSITVVVDASDLEFGIDTVTIFENGEEIGTATRDPNDGLYRFRYDPPGAGEHNLDIRVTNGAGGTQPAAVRLFAIPR